MSATMTDKKESLQPPSRLLMLAEARAFWEAGATLAIWPWLQLTPRGDGHPVFVLPGFMASDSSTTLLRRFLRGRGYHTHGWKQGRNFGPRDGVEAGMAARLQAIYDQAGGRKVSLIGWSLGGVYARLLATKYPHLVRDVITLGSPFGGSPKATNAWRLYEAMSGKPADDHERLDRVRSLPPVPTTSIFSRTDGVVAWQCSIDRPGPQNENIEVFASHIGMGAHPAVLYALADRLAQPENAWKPFDGKLLGPMVYPDPNRP
jgi:pimeloyl-ACP methyl ester carboxylesterase